MIHLKVMKLRGEKESWARKEEEREVELQRLRHQEQDLKIEKEALEQKLATVNINNVNTLTFCSGGYRGLGRTYRIRWCYTQFLVCLRNIVSLI